MDLIGRQAAIDATEDPVIKGYVMNALKNVPSVPAVPLDKLCEWLGMHAVPPVSDCLLTTEARTAAWKAVLNKFVEEQDAAD